MNQPIKKNQLYSMNPDQLASFLQKATSTPQNIPKNPTPSTPQNMSQLLEKYQRVLSPNDFNDLNLLAISLQKQEIFKPEFESGFQKILLRNQDQTQMSKIKQLKLKLQFLQK
jgi:hypothetical protein